MEQSNILIEAAAPSWSPADWEQDVEKCKKSLEDHWNIIPFLNVTPSYQLKDQQLVRFCGMIQHMHNPEYFLGQYQVSFADSGRLEMRSGRYRDVLSSSDSDIVTESPKNVIEERQVLFCTTIPALNDWVFQESNQQSGQRRSLFASKTLESNKRPVEDISENHEENQSTSHNTKRVAIENRANPIGEQSNLSSSVGKEMGCLLKLYEMDNHPSLHLNDVIEVVGFLSVDPSLANYDNIETGLPSPPPSAVPRIHVVSMKKVEQIFPRPLDLDFNFGRADSIRKELKLLLTQIMLGDALAAEYLICHLISLVYLRKDGIALGHFSVNFANLPQLPDYTSHLYSILERLLPKSHYLPMSLENMNSFSLIPKMDYEENRLVSGVLQLSNNTHLVVDETKLEAGKLDETGVRNVQALNQLIMHQAVDYDFQYYRKQYDADIPVLILSEGKSLLPSDVLVHLNWDSECLDTLSQVFQAAGHFLREPLLTEIRTYLSVMRHASCEFPEDVQKKAQDDFVEMRRINGQKVTADDLHLLLVLTRLVSLSHGEREISIESWELAVEMEKERKARILHRQEHRQDSATSASEP